VDQVATVFLNGEYLPLEEAKIPVLDRGFIFGDGVYEVVPVYSKVAFRLDEHLARLERSLAGVGIRNPYTREQWRGFVEGIVARQSFEDQAVYFQVTRGVAKRDHAFPKDVQPTVFMMSNPLVPPARAQVEAGAAAITARDNRWHRCDIKSISLIGANKMPLEFDAIKEAEVRAADEIWVTSSSKEVLAIVRLDGAPVGDGKPGPVFRRMYQAYQDFKHRVMRAGRRESLPA
jgi:branched-subunit amino acid aminotransferase/4-amino-4-deoxychorismate lyase